MGLLFLSCVFMTEGGPAGDILAVSNGILDLASMNEHRLGF